MIYMIIIDRIIEKGHHNHPKGVFLMKKFALLALLGAAAAGAAAVCVKVIKDRKSNLDADYTECPCEGENPPQAPVQEPAQKPEEKPVSEEFYEESESEGCEEACCTEQPCKECSEACAEQPCESCEETCCTEQPCENCEEQPVEDAQIEDEADK